MKPTVTSHKAPLGILGEHLIDEAAVHLGMISNFHSFAWLENEELKGPRPVEAVVHRKGATPPARVCAA